MPLSDRGSSSTKSTLRGTLYAAIRSRGTIGGSIAHADPAAELPAVAVCLDARLTIASSRTQRTVSAEDFFLEYLTTMLEPDMLFMIHPNQYLPETGYLLCGEPVLLTERGAEPLTRRKAALAVIAG